MQYVTRRSAAAHPDVCQPCTAQQPAATVSASAVAGAARQRGATCAADSADVDRLLLAAKRSSALAARVAREASARNARMLALMHCEVYSTASSSTATGSSNSHSSAAAAAVAAATEAIHAVQWQCNVCTLLNDSSSRACAVCEQVQPAAAITMTASELTASPPPPRSTAQRAAAGTVPNRRSSSSSSSSSSADSTTARSVTAASRQSHKAAVPARAIKPSSNSCTDVAAANSATSASTAAVAISTGSLCAYGAGYISGNSSAIAPAATCLRDAAAVSSAETGVCTSSVKSKNGKSTALLRRRVSESRAIESLTGIRW
jgi:trimeric autotransporter adhesin